MDRRQHRLATHDEVSVRVPDGSQGHRRGPLCGLRRPRPAPGCRRQDDPRRARDEFHDRVQVDLQGRRAHVLPRPREGRGGRPRREEPRALRRPDSRRPGQPLGHLSRHGDQRGGRPHRPRGHGVQGRRGAALLPDEPWPLRAAGHGDDRQRLHRAHHPHAPHGVRRRVEPAHRAADGGIGRLTYRERAPHPALADYIACTWADEARPGLRVLPDGCIDIVWIGDEALTVAGPDTQANVIGLAEGTLTVGIRFRPGRAPGFLRMDAQELTDQSVGLDALWGADAKLLADALASAPSVEGKQAILEAALLERLEEVREVDPDVDAALDVIVAAPSQTRIGALSRDLNISERHLRRRFEQAIGYGPKTFGRVLRFRAFLSLVEEHGYSIAQAAAEAGYADQAHLTRECNDLAGLPPAELLKVRNVQDP